MRNINLQDEEGKKLVQLIERYDATAEQITLTKAKVNVLWKAYEFTDELSPYMEFLEEVRR